MHAAAGPFGITRNPKILKFPRPQPDVGCTCPPLPGGPDQRLPEAALCGAHHRGHVQHHLRQEDRRARLRLQEGAPPPRARRAPLFSCSRTEQGAALSAPKADHTHLGVRQCMLGPCVAQPWQAAGELPLAADSVRMQPRAVLHLRAACSPGQGPVRSPAASDDSPLDARTPRRTRGTRARRPRSTCARG